MQQILRRSFLALLVLLLLPVSAWAQVGLQKALQAQQQHNPNLFAINGVTATGISVDDQGTAIVKVLVEHPGVAVPQKLGAVKVQKAVSGKIFAWDDMKAQRGKPPKGGGGSSPTDRFPRAVPIGVSLGAFKPIQGATNYCFAGTLGCRLKAEYPGGAVAHFILSNNHVMADENGGNRNIDVILQPGTLDNNCTYDPNDQIGELTDFVEIDFSENATNLMDAAIALTDTSMTGVGTPEDGYGVPSVVDVAATVGMPVCKYGRTTGYTEGLVDMVNVSVNVGYDGGTARFTNQVVFIGRVKRGNKIVNGPFSDSGDSGSLIVTKDGNHPTALLFAGNSTYTIGNPIGAVLTEFSVREGAVITVDGN